MTSALWASPGNAAFAEGAERGTSLGSNKASGASAVGNPEKQE